MKKIELEQWEPFPGDPRRMQYAGRRIAQEVFEELKHRLEGMGYLPDEYFLMDREWDNGRKIPKDADIFCVADYGGSEGTYLDVYLKWYEDSRPVTKSFITGKTLGESGADLDRMFLISSAITKAFHGDHETYARYLRQGERAEPESMIVHLKSYGAAHHHQGAGGTAGTPGTGHVPDGTAPAADDREHHRLYG